MEAPDSRKHSKFNPKYEILEKIIVEFLRKARERGVCVTGPMLITNAQMKAKQLGIEGFSGSDGWLTRVKERNEIAARILSGESKSVNLTILNDWVKELPTILEGYDDRDVYNTDETGLFLRLVPKSPLWFRGMMHMAPRSQKTESQYY